MLQSSLVSYKVQQVEGVMVTGGECWCADRGEECGAGAAGC